MKTLRKNLKKINWIKNRFGKTSPSEEILRIRNRYWDSMKLWHRHNLFFSNYNSFFRICSNYFRTTTVSENLLFQIKHFLRAVSSSNSNFFRSFTSSQQLLLFIYLFFHNSNFFRKKLLPSSYLLKIDSSCW